MDNSTASLREQGIQAFRDGELDKAVDLLARAVMADDNDAESRAVLGIVYSQKGLHDQAKRALQNAVSLDPQNPKFLYNLGLARERADDPQGAAIAFADTLKADPRHPQARARLDGMGPAATQYLAAREKPSEPVGVPHTQPDPDPAAGGLNAPPSGGLVMPSAMPASAPPAAGLAAGSMAGGGLAAADETGPPGTVKCDACGQWSPIGMTCDFCQSPLKPPAPIAHTDRPAYTSAAAAATATGSGSGWYEDKFDVKEAFVDWLNVLVRPAEFFKEQADREGLNAPLSFLFACGMIVGIAGTLIGWLMRLVGMGTGADTNFMQMGFRGACMGIGLCILMFICSAFVHMLARLFGGQAGFSGTFRAVSYAGAPITLFYCLWTLVDPVIQKSMLQPALKKVAVASPAPPSSRASLAEAQGGVMLAQAEGGVMLAQADTAAARKRAAAARATREAKGREKPDIKKIGSAISQIGTVLGIIIAIQLPGYVWAWCLLAFGLMHVHKLSMGSAASVVAIAVAVIAAIAGTLFFVFSQAIAAFMGLAAGAANAGGASGAPADTGAGAELNEDE